LDGRRFFRAIFYGIFTTVVVPISTISVGSIATTAVPLLLLGGELARQGGEHRRDFGAVARLELVLEHELGEEQLQVVHLARNLPLEADHVIRVHVLEEIEMGKLGMFKLKFSIFSMEMSEFS
jgi:hypothetical protein